MTPDRSSTLRGGAPSVERARLLHRLWPFRMGVDVFHGKRRSSGKTSG